MEQEIAVIERLKREKGNILIVTHENPDGDGIGSMIALYKFLLKKGKNVTMAMKDDLPHIYDFLPEGDKIQKLPLDKEFDLVIIVDAAGLFRAGAEVKGKEVIRIDHHVDGISESEYDYVDSTAPSTTYLVGIILREWDEKDIDKDIAECLYTGLLTDTGSFRYNNVDERAFEMAEFLIEKGANPSYISTMVYERNRPNVIHLLHKVLSTLKMDCEGHIASLVVRRDFIDDTDALEEETEGFVNFARSIENVDVAFIMIQKPDRKTWRVSLRGKGKINVQKIAKMFGGGGHKDAAGCRIIGSEEKVRGMLVETIKKEINKYTKECIKVA
ncbi:DHH family phosphoesterase [Persephonella sp.]